MSQHISSILQENRVFPPPIRFQQHANITSFEEYDTLRKIANENVLDHWDTQAKKLVWFKKWETILDWNYPKAQWYKEGTINASINCLDKHIGTEIENKTAIIWEGEDGIFRTFSYKELHELVSRFAQSLLNLNIKKNDVVAIYMGMVPEAVIAMLACSRIGAIHNVVFGGFSSDALRDRINDSKAVAVITQDAALRRGTTVELLPAVERAITESPTVKDIIVYHRLTGSENSDNSYHDFYSLINNVNRGADPLELPSEHPLFILYTSGSTGKPKGILHTTGGYLTHGYYSFEMVFDIKQDDVYFCTADIGWITGHSYVTYAPLMHGSTMVMYEGALNYPKPNRIWELIDKHKVTILYTAPTAIRSFMSSGNEYVLSHSLDSLRLLGTVGEPINPEAWMWYHTIVGKEKCPIVDTWWQTETGGIMIAPVPGAIATKPGTATLPLPGILADIVHKDGSPCKANEGGFLVIKHPWPGMARTLFGDSERFNQVYWSEFPPCENHQGYYFTGDGARKDEDGYFWIIGRVDDVVNVSGHRLGTAEIESALVAHPAVAEAAVVSKPDPIKGNALVAFVTLMNSFSESKELIEELRSHVAKEIGHIAKPDEIRFAKTLPKTRSGKIMRRLLRELVAGGIIKGDITTLEDVQALEHLRDEEE